MLIEKGMGEGVGKIEEKVTWAVGVEWVGQGNGSLFLGGRGAEGGKGERSDGGRGEHCWT